MGFSLLCSDTAIGPAPGLQPFVIGLRAELHDPVFARYVIEFGECENLGSDVLSPASSYEFRGQPTGLCGWRQHESGSEPPLRIVLNRLIESFGDLLGPVPRSGGFSRPDRTEAKEAERVKP